MHVTINGEILNGLRMMKYAINHPWKFKYHRTAVITGFLQFTAMFLIAMANYMVITISEAVIDIAKDFTALLIIADFDDIFSTASQGSSKGADLVSGDYEEMFTIETTTSNDARKPFDNEPLAYDPVYEKMMETQPKADFTCYPRKRPETIRVFFGDRALENKFFYLIYKFFRIFHVTIWFYFFPFLALLVTYGAPIISKLASEEQEEEMEEQDL